MSPTICRREFLTTSAALSACVLAGGQETLLAAPQEEFRLLFDGQSLQGWTPRPRPPVPRLPDMPPPVLAEAQRARVAAHAGRWVVEDGAIIGGPDPPDSRLGAYLVSDGVFRDFELELEARPDWRVDTGIMVRASTGGGVGIQVLCDHRPGGGLGGFYFNGTGGFLAAPFFLDGKVDGAGRLTGLVPSQSTQKQPALPVDFAGDVDEFLAAWKINDWNRFRIRCSGELPRLSTEVNGVRVAELDLSRLQHELWHPDSVRATISAPGHIAFEVHSIGAQDSLGEDRWAPGAVCRWRNIRIREL